ncbi:helix-turn-helix domain-containing protein [Tumebacillus permanentifrigoris]|uniref:Tetratricopeptide repeat protein n=1 Tax=Tumebacillus permanentifrigoris TaxID=378543 RepID=A0A316D6C0_9BACL|nr:tetratricopeptide repeat protein [Tumebacillus permanentifrigoris]PWK10213.1 tetratricopeptide repeat protein [Tumebacillus permanentifrigoris]
MSEPKVRKGKTAEQKLEITKFNATLATNLIFFRNERKLSQDDLEALSGIAKSNISRIENCTMAHSSYEKKFNADFIRMLAQALKVAPDALTESDFDLQKRLDSLESAVKKWPIPEEAIIEANELLGMVENRGPRERAIANLSRGLIEYSKWRVSRSLDFFEDAYDYATKSSDEVLIQKVRYNLSTALMAGGRYERAEIFMLQTYKEAISEENKARSLLMLGSLYAKRNRLDRAEKKLNEALEIIPDGPQYNVIKAQCLQSLGSVLSRLEKFEESIETTLKAIDLAKGAQDKLSLIYGLKVLGEVFFAGGDAKNGVAALTEALSEANKFGRNYERLMIRFFLNYHENNYDDLKETLLLELENDAPPHHLVDQYEKASNLARKLGFFDDAIEYLMRVNLLLKDR